MTRRTQLSLAIAGLVLAGLAATSAVALHWRGRPWRSFAIGRASVLDVLVFERTFALRRWKDETPAMDRGETWEVRSLETGALLREVVRPLGWSPLTGRVLLSRRTGEVSLEDPVTGETFASVEGLEPEVTLAAVTLREDEIALVASVDSVEVRSLPGGIVRKRIAVQTVVPLAWRPSSLAFAPRGDLVALESVTGKSTSHPRVTAWRVATGEQVACQDHWLVGFTSVGQLVIRQQGDAFLVAATHRDGTVRDLWIARGVWNAALSAFGDRLGTLACDESGSAIAVSDASLSWRDAVRSARIFRSATPAWDRDLGLSPDAATLLVACEKESRVDLYRVE